jgi:hypothetical protein
VPPGTTVGSPGTTAGSDTLASLLLAKAKESNPIIFGNQ